MTTRSIYATSKMKLKNAAIAAKSAAMPSIPKDAMLVTDKGQVTIPKHIRVAAGVAAGSEVSFSLEGSKIVITLLATNVENDRRAELRQAAAGVRASLSAEFSQLDADDIMNFLRGDGSAAKGGRRQASQP